MYGSYVFLLVYAFIALLHPSVAAKALIGLNPNLIANYTANPLKVCIHPTPPLVMCDPVREQNQYTGFGVELFRLVYGGELGLREGEQYNFNCTEFENLIPQLSTPNSYCDIGLGGLVVTPERQSMGIRNSYPYYRSSLAIVVQSEVVGTSGWVRCCCFSSFLFLLPTVYNFNASGMDQALCYLAMGGCNSDDCDFPVARVCYRVSRFETTCSHGGFAIWNRRGDV